MSSSSRENRLARESSSYLRQHARNPVDWYPWGPEALERARAEDKPIFLSIGYSACHWCHVMERESFEDARIAAIMNERYVNIKVDREERPDLDEIYMAATQMISGQGGWPNSLFLSPDGRPFFAGTYFPPEPRWGRPSFEQVLVGAADAYRGRRAEIDQVAAQVTDQIRRLAEVSPSKEAPGAAILTRAFGDLAGRFDAAEGGFGAAPKFPHAPEISFLLRHYRRAGNPEALRMAVISLEKMAAGGMRDQIGGGFHRYSVDARWLVPHFEKMLYDNALLARVYLEAAQTVARLGASAALPRGGAMAAASFREVARDTLDWALRDMAAPEGGFCASLDADSEGEEGRYYVWTPEEIAAALGEDDARLFGAAYGVTPQGNFEGGGSILHVAAAPEAIAARWGIGEADLRLRLAAARGRLLQARARRVAPGRDDKILVDWNSLMIGALAYAARVLDDPRYLDAARRAARLILERLRPEGRLRHSLQEGQARHPALLGDHAGLIAALIDLHSATLEPVWIAEARGLAEAMIDLFWDAERGGFMLTPRDHEPLIARVRESNDGAVPAGVSMAALALPRLAVLAGVDDFRRKAEETLRLYRDRLERFPAAFGALLGALDQHLGRQRQVVLAGRRGDPALVPFVDRLRTIADPDLLLALADPDDPEAARAVPLVAGKMPLGGKPAAYVCESGTCAPPVTSPDALPDH